MPRSLLIVGAGGHGRVVADAAQLSGAWERIAFVDDQYPELKKILNWPVIGSLSDLDRLAGTWTEVVVAIGGNATRLDLIRDIKNYKYDLTCVIHPSAQIAKDVKIGDGTVIFANAVINTGSVVKDGCIINTAATVDHDNRIGIGTHISPGVHLAGNVNIGDRSWIGIGASVIHGCTVGNDVIVGAGAVVTNDLDSGITVVGVPARELLK